MPAIGLAPLRAALADLVVGREQDGLRRRRRLRGADRICEVASDQRAGVSVPGPQFREGVVVIDAGQPEQRRDQVGVVGRDLELACAAGQQRAGDDERDAQSFVVGAVPLLVKAAVRALHVAVVGAEDHDRVLVGVGLAQRVQDARDLLTDGGLHLVVELQVRLDPRLRRRDLGPEVDDALLAARLGRQVFLVRRRLRDVRDLRGVVAQPLLERDDTEERVVVRVQERADRQPRLVARRRRRDA